MKKLQITFLLLFMTILLFGCNKDKSNKDNTNKEEIPTAVPTVTQAAEETGDTKLVSKTNYFDDQTAIDQSLKKEAVNGYSFDEPMVIVNPYGTSPLTAVAIFSTDSVIGGTVTVKGKSSEDDITGSFPVSKDHIVPIYGLYAGTANDVVLTLDDGTSSTVEVTTDVLDFSTDGFTAVMKEAASYDYSKLTFVCDFNANVFALDSKGDLRWFYNHGGTLGVKPLANGHLALPAYYTLRPMYYKSGIIEIDLLGKVYNEYMIPGGMHHDIFEMPDGNLLVGSDRPTFDTVEDYIVELDRKTGEILWELDLAELIDPSEGGSINRTDEDWFHNNAIFYDGSTDTLLLSGRHVDAIIGVDMKEKKLKWILGDPDGWSDKYQKYFFTPVGNNFEWQYAQHQVSVLSDGNIMCFDNGAGRTKDVKPDKKVTGAAVYSRAVIYHTDAEKMTIEQVWEFGKELGGPFNSEWVSAAISLDNDPNNIWTSAGSNLYNPDKKDYDYGPEDMFNPALVPSTNVYQVKNNKIVYNLKLNLLSYRTLRISLYGDAGAYDVNAQGHYLGSLGVTPTLDVKVDLANAEAAQDCTLSLDPVKLTLDASYTIPTADTLQDSYFVLRKADGSVLAYDTNQATTDNAADVTVNVTGYISPRGLEGASYDVYVVLGGKAYNTGYKVEF